MAADKFWSHFKSGTDIRGVAVDGVEGEPLDLTDEIIEKITKAFACFIYEKAGKNGLSVAVGHDSRISAERIKVAVIKALVKSGMNVIDCGLSSTPAMFMTTVDLKCDASIQITASHHPYHRNGLKFFLPTGGLEGKDISVLLDYAEREHFIISSKEGTVKTENYMERYSKNLCDMIKKGVNADDYDHPLKGYKIVVDAGNGAGGFYAEKVLKVLGADTEGSRYLEPDGMFPNHIPNPENEKAMESICEAVKESHADFGVIFDTDVDRAGCVDSFGNEINRNRLIALASAIALEGNEGGTIVTDSVTSSGLKEFIEKDLGGVHHRFKRGYKNVINESIRLNNEGINSPLAIETSGHAALRENYFLDDGAYLITKIIIKLACLGKEGKTLTELTSALKEPVESKEIRMKILEEDFAACGNGIISALEEYAESKSDWHIAPDNREGIRVSFDKENGDGWFLLRLSVHDPIMPLNIESDSVGGVKKIAKKLFEFLKTVQGLDISPVEEFVK